MISFIVDNWVGVLAGILSIIGAVLAIVHEKKQKGDATMPKETTTQTSDRGSINISAEGGSSVTVTGVIASNGNNDGTDSADKLDEKLESEYESIQIGRAHV